MKFRVIKFVILVIGGFYMINISDFYTSRKNVNIYDHELMTRLEIIFKTMISSKQINKIKQVNDETIGKELVSFLRRSKHLNSKVDSIASLTNVNISRTTQKIVISRNIIYNRINKAGSTKFKVSYIE